MKQSAELYADEEKSLYIQVLKPHPDPAVQFSVRRFYLKDPATGDTSDCDVHEMAWATSMQCRFTGHVRRRYSVAEHCVFTSHLMSEPEVAERGGTAYEALMHDAHEGYVSDLAAPWKAEVTQYRAFEAVIEGKMRRQFGLPAKGSEGVKFADWLMLFIEAEQLLGRGVSKAWLQPEPGTRDLAIEIARRSARYILPCWGEFEAYTQFLDRYARVHPSGAHPAP